MADDNTSVAEEGAPVTQAQFRQLMGALDVMQKQINKSSMETAEKVSKKLRRESDKSYQFKKRGNKLQFEFNDEVMEKLEDAQVSLKDMPAEAAAGSKRARELLEEGMQQDKNC